jgi:hypothetical protein
MNEFKGCAITMLNTFLLMLIALLAFSSESQAALYNIVGTKDFVNGLPASLTAKERAKLIEMRLQAQTETACIGFNCALLDKAKAKAKIKAIIATETPPVVTPPISTIITYPDGRPSIDTAFIPPSFIGYDSFRLKAATDSPKPSPDDHGAFRIICYFSHMNFDDPIVYPNQKDAAHLHAYFGNTKTDYTSTPESIRTTGNSSCEGGTINRTSYWMPPPIDTATNKPIQPTKMEIYYKNNGIIPIPRGLRMISGDMRRATSVTPSWERKQYYECNDVYSNKQDNLISCTGTLTMWVVMQNCWDGKNLDSPNHKDHMAYWVNGVCPATHPVRIPTITTKTYLPAPNGTSTWRLSSDMYPKVGQNAGFSAHADFFMGWDEAIHKIAVDRCINAGVDCHSHLLGDGRMYY